MRLFYVIGSLESGGAEQHLYRVAVALKERSYQPEVFAMQLSGPLVERLRMHQVPVHGVVLPALVRRVLRNQRLIAWVHLIHSAAFLWSLYWRRRPDVIHFFLPSAYIVGGIISLFGPPTRKIMSRRSLNLYQNDHLLFGRIERYLHRYMDMICGNSKAVLRDLVKEGVPDRKLRLIYNGVPTPSLNSISQRLATREDLKIDPECLVFITVANLIPYKGHLDLLEALSQIAHKLPRQWRLLCVGRDDGIGKMLQKRSQSLGLSNNVFFLGSRTDVFDLLTSSDIGVLASHQEGFSNALIESMVAGLPMVVTDVGGNSEAVVHGNTGYVVPVRSPEALAAALFALAISLDARHQMGAKGKERAEKLFSLPMCVDQYERLYRGELDSA